MEGLSLIRVDDNYEIKPFDCGDADLNDFLITKSKPYCSELLATSFVLEDSNNTIAFFSIFNDSLRVEEKDFASKSQLKRFLSGIVSHPKRHLDYFPAIKIGRLAVNTCAQNSGIGKQIINFIIDFAIMQNDNCACKFIIVDAYANSLGFYERLGFKYLSDIDKEDEIRQMRLDLTPLINASKAIH